VQLKRIKSITDESLFSFSYEEQPFFNPESYQPLFTLSNLEVSYERLYKLTNKKTNKIKLILIKKFASICMYLTKNEYNRDLYYLLTNLKAEITPKMVNKFYNHLRRDK
jgi:hypothetical protein